jgi:hypothetical protein
LKHQTDRAALRLAIRERNGAKAQFDNAEAAVARAQFVIDELEAKCAKLEEATVKAEDAAALTAAEHIKRLTTCGASPADLNPSDDLIKTRRECGNATEQLRAAKATHEVLVRELTQFSRELERVNAAVAAEALKIIKAAGEDQAVALREAWASTWRSYDKAIALLDGLRLPCLSAEINRLLQTVGGFDVRQHAGGRNVRVASAFDCWRRWYAALLDNADAVATFESESAPTPTREPAERTNGYSFPVRGRSRQANA